MIFALASDKFYPDVNPPNIVVPYANAETNPGILAATKLNLETQGLYPSYVDMNANLDSPFAYYNLLKDLWSESKPFIIVEHDILPWPGALKQLWECDCAWGAFRYTVFGEFRAYLGCTKFDPVKLGEFPLQSPVVWSNLDLKIVTELTKRGFRGHLHNPPVSHLNFSHQLMTRSIRVTK